MAQIEAHIGDVSGGSQVAVGNYIVQIGRVEGGVVNILNEAPPPPRIRPQPVLLRPKVFPGLLDRQTETATALNALNSQQSVECTGQPGAGRTSLLRHLAHQPQLATVFPAGIIYFQVNQQSAADLLKSLFDAFYICDFPIKPNETEMRHYLQSVNALVLLDDVEIGAQQIDYLMNIAPNCMFVAVTRERGLSSDVVEVSVKGLPTADAVLLYEKELGRPLWSEEESKARSICEAVDCIPLLVVREAHKSRESSTDEKKVLAALAVFSGTSVAAEHVAAIAGVQNVQTTLASLEERGLVQSHEQHYAVAPEVQQEEPDDLKPWFTRALNYFVNWTEQHHNDHKLIAASGEAILLLLKQAVDVQSWGAVRNLGHACEEALTVTGKWDMWANVLDSIEIAGKAQGDVAERAWVLHQLGTRALCLGERFEAEAALHDALGLRERLGDASGAAITRHNLDILLVPVPSDSNDKDSGGSDNVGPGSASLLAKVAVLSLVGVAVVTVLLVVRYLNSRQTVEPPQVASFSVNPATIPANGKAQLCYEVENAESVRIEPNIGERRPATKDCIDVTPSETLTYTLTAFAANGSTATSQATLTVDAAAPPPLPKADIVYFAVERENGPAGVNAVNFQLCYEVRNAAHAELDGNAVVLDRRQCQPIAPQQTTTYTLSATGSDGITLARKATVDITKPPEPRPQIVTFYAERDWVVDDGTTKVCYQLKNASSAQLDPGARTLNVSADKQCLDVRPLKSTSFTLKAFNAEGKEEHAKTFITVVPSPQVIEFTVSPQRITRGESVTLCFRAENSLGVTIEPDGPINHAAGRGERVCLQKQPRATTTYSVVAFNYYRGLSSKPRQETVTVEAPQLKHARILFFDASPLRFKQGERIRLCYGVADAKTTTISTLRSELPNSEKNCFDQSPRESTKYVLAATGEDNQTETRELNVIMEEPPAPPVRITRFEIKRRILGGPQLCYGLENARSARIEPGIGALTNLTGDCRNLPSREQQTYILTASGADQKSDTRSITYTPPEPPPIGIVSFTGPTRPIKARSEAKLCYSTFGEGKAEIRPSPGPVPPSIKNCVSVFPDRTTEYTLTVTSPQGEGKSRTVTVTVEGPVIQ